MAVVWTAPRPGEEGSVGHVRATLTVTNRADQIRADSGVIRTEEVRTVTLDNVLVDTGATLLGLPADVIAQLGLAYRQDITARTAAAPRRTRRFRDAEITLLGRSGTFDCIELPGGASALLGVIPLETLGIEPDVRNGTLRLLPEGPDESHILAYSRLP
jgi:predicted aspartyl protease